MTDKKSFLTFLWRIAASHTIAYFIAGVLALVFLNYKDHYASDSLSLLMLPVDTPIVALGPALQIIRGLILALVLYPFRSVIFSNKGFLKLAVLILGLSYLSTIGPTPGSFEGIIYTILPLQYHLPGIPETLIYIGLFTGILAMWYKFDKKYITIISVILVILIIIMGIMGYMASQNPMIS